MAKAIEVTLEDGHPLGILTHAIEMYAPMIAGDPTKGTYIMLRNGKQVNVRESYGTIYQKVIAG
ncbi:hypothetical protein HOS22_gp32 [Rhizobium phage RHEph08]|uniref:Uncharacterized protein n=5 Tax=Cuernavacavirus TaxID=2731935 RepID=A0A7S5QYP1_9CAUD|nr:hypothetical protein HOS21_gp32 [Rhizobium phage RHEph02]YP_009793215.1 hypothetical protein HOS22_gp32 [Rhizobium phage RHEph08]YP_009793269.1 hypothetical protein HOS23_gp27 [Rhizobium phage RHEph09]AGC35660.1 hypothetical protein RHEph03_gp033 [Rhizobium phage RHEph03]QIG68428.1 hypothetical protein EVB62_026 [Rhizobium phage RHph_TM33]QIG68484.1 hypothetical protein EVB63_025 [Rhizobium phage RHph_TM38]AGC35599.1 hypothetical protein RHEph02_gp032 [Rhizobium phage RHEph02]AGC35956.1 h